MGGVGRKASGSHTPVFFTMANVNRSKILFQLQDSADLQVGSHGGKAISQLREEIIPTLDINPKYTDIVKSANTNSTASLTIYTTPSNKDFYMTSAHFTVTKDATCDNTSAFISIIAGGATCRILPMRFQTTTAGSTNSAISFPHPIKIDRGTVIQIVGGFGAGAMLKEATITGFILE